MNFKTPSHKQYVKKMLLQKMEKKFSQEHHPLIEAETEHFVQTQNITKEAVKLLEQQIARKMMEKSKS